MVEVRNVSFRVGYEMFDHDGGEIVARAQTLLAPYDLALGRPRRLTDRGEGLPQELARHVTLIFDSASDRADAAAFLARVTRLDPSAPVRVRCADGVIALWAWLPLEVLATRQVRGAGPADVTVDAKLLRDRIAVPDVVGVAALVRAQRVARRAGAAARQSGRGLARCAAVRGRRAGARRDPGRGRAEPAGGRRAHVPGGERRRRSPRGRRRAARSRGAHGLRRRGQRGPAAAAAARAGADGLPRRRPAPDRARRGLGARRGQLRSRVPPSRPAGAVPHPR